MKEMNWTVEQKKIIEKVDFYRLNEIKAHVLIIPKPQFKNGLFVSDLQDGLYFWFIESKTAIPIRLFLNEIYDVEEYQDREVTE